MRNQTVTSIAALATLAALLAAGCSSPVRTGPTVSRAAGASSRQIPNVTLAEVQPISEQVFRQRFRLNSAASGPGLIVAQPQEVTGEAHRERVRDVLGGIGTRHRRLAELRLDQQGPNVLLRCTVQTQRLETSERAAFSAQRGGDDRPTETPIDRLGAASADYREEWGPAKRDRELEQEILKAIEEALRPATSPAS